MSLRPVNCLSIDVEDYFQVSAFEGLSSLENWDAYECRVDQNTRRVLDVLDQYSCSGTFFILGWVAERYPELVREVAKRGHEIASHGFSHKRLPNLTREDFRREISDSKALLEDLSGQEVLGYRAPSYSVQSSTLWAFDELLEAGYKYDSSVFPIVHDFYGLPDWPDEPFWAVRGSEGNWTPGNLYREDSKGPTTDGLLEIPIATLPLAGKKWPIAGGGYFRLYPYPFTRWGLKRLNRRGKIFVFYLHPWEFDPDQPRMVGAGLKSRFRHYLNLSKTEGRFQSLLRDFNFQPIRSCLH